MLERLKEGFKNPGVEFRGAPFWSWNDDLTEDELRHQIREMKRVGLGGYFMHARTGLVTPYMGEEWMKCIAVCIDEGKRIGMKSWLYDEDCWPSGFAGGMVSGRGKEYTQRALGYREQHINWEVSQFVPHNTYLKYYLGEKEGKTIRNLKDVTGQAILVSSHRGETIFEFYVESRNRYVDLLNPKVVQAFIETTHEHYYQRFGKEFGLKGNIPGIFTDEPEYGWGLPPWTDELPRYFKERRGYDLVENLPSLFYEVEDYKKVRHDFYRTVTEMFVEIFTKRLYEWCETHKINLTGHSNENEKEDVLWWQVHLAGAVMPHYEFMHIPGIDHLGREVNLNPPPLIKQVSSVAHQFKGRRVLSETFGCAGGNMTFEDQKWLAERQFVLGVDLLCQHLSLYSLRGCRKRDCPPSLNYYQPWWDYFRIVNDRFARICFMLTQGKHVTDILVIHPISSAWCIYHPSDKKPAMELNRKFLKLSNLLLGIHRDYDYGDEIIMQKHAKINKGRIKVGSCSYSVVIVPPSISLFSKTFSLLQEFVKQGGKLIAVNPLPYMIEGKKHDDLVKFLEKDAKVIPNETKAVKQALEKISAPTIRIRANGQDATTIYYQERKLERKKIFYIVNTSKERNVESCISIQGKGQLQLWDSNTGEIEQIPYQLQNDRVVTEINLAPIDSRILLLDPDKEPLVGSSIKESTIQTVKIDPPWSIRRHNLNALTIDYCDYQINDIEWKENQPVIWLNRTLMEKGERCKLKVRYKFNFEELPSLNFPLFLVIETPFEFQIKLNGKEIDSVDKGYWLDQAFRKLDIAGLVKIGTNTVEISTTFRPPMEIESCYIIGDFGVKSLSEKEFVMTRYNNKVIGKNLVNEGLPFYCGTVTLTKELNLLSGPKFPVKKVYLELENLNAVVAHVFLNNKSCGVIAWRNWKLDISKFVKRGRNSLSIKLAGSLRNLLGPHHYKGGDPLRVGPLIFEGGPRRQNWVDAYNFVPFGVEGVIIRYVHT